MRERTRTQRTYTARLTNACYVDYGTDALHQANQDMSKVTPQQRSDACDGCRYPG